MLACGCKRWRYRRCAGVVSSALLGLFAMTGGGLAAASLTEIEERGKLVMLCWPHQESQFVRRLVKEYGPEGLNRFGGLDVDLMRAFAAELGVELEVKPVTTSFAELIPSLLDGEGDLVASSLTITKRRSERVAFSLPYYRVRKVVVTSLAGAIASVHDLDGKIGAVVAGSSHEEHLRALGSSDLQLLLTDFVLESYQAVKEGSADFTLVDSGSADRVLNGYAEFRSLRRAFDFPVDDLYGVAVAPSDRDLLERLNEFLARMRGNGELAALQERHPPLPGSQASR